ncbi:uncharacterized protein CBL_03888 [Carabus blaptoides fortunei]
MATSLSPQDPSSFARPDECIVRELHLSLDINFDKKILSGKADLKVEKVNPIAKEIILDSAALTVLSITDLTNNRSLDYKISPEVPTFGSKLVISFPEDQQTCFSIQIHYETSPKASGLQWLGANQTMGMQHPFMFSQFQAVHARSVVPCQDTPSVKVPFTADITAPTGITVLMGAVRINEPAVLIDGRTRYQFQQKVPIPAYLIAFAAGKLDSRKIGPRSHVWAEPELVEKAAYEFGETERMLRTAEEICGPYVWGIYDLLVLPPSFPFGGMENPCLTFVTPTVIAGDRSLALVVAHEIAHSWTGNLVTNRNFEHFWLNEGFTMFVERKIAGRMRGRAVQDFEAITGINALQETIKKMGETNALTKLVLDLKGVHPDDSFSVVPYEKGHIFLRYIESVVGGPAEFEPFLKQYLDTFKYRSIDTDDFKQAFLKHFNDKASVKQIDWQTWLFGTGMPPVIPDYDKTLVDVCITLRDKWFSWNVSSDPSVFSPKDIAEMNSNQLDYFLQLLLDSEPLPLAKLQHMETVYKLNDTNNAEIKFRWIRIGLKARWIEKVEDALKMVTEVGRMKFLRPLYGDLYKWEEVRQRAIATFQANRKDMMYVSAYTVKQDLHLEN